MSPQLEVMNNGLVIPSSVFTLKLSKVHIADDAADTGLLSRKGMNETDLVCVNPDRPSSKAPVNIDFDLALLDVPLGFGHSPFWIPPLESSTIGETLEAESDCNDDCND